MDIKNEYEKLYQHWQKELNQISLSSFTQENFSNYKKVINEIDKVGDNEQNSIKLDLLNSYQDNLKFLLSDFLKIRELKIMNTALSLREIDFNNLIEAEKMYYQNLVSSIKGFEKMKALSTYTSSEDVSIKKIEVEQIDDTKKIESIEIKVESEMDVSQGSQERPSIVPTLVDEKKKEDFNYTLLRFIRKTPALVGIDLINYGPF